MSSGVRMLAWSRADEGRGHSMARVERIEGGWRCRAAEVLSSPDGTLSCSFTIDLDVGWVTRTVEVDSVSDLGARHVSLRSDDRRDWWRDDVLEPALRGCIDVDVSATPLTNTFPINRLTSLAVGEHHTAAVAWVDVPSLRVSRVEQTYLRLAQDRWQYSDETYGAFELSVDDGGFVIDYEGFATRVRH